VHAVGDLRRALLPYDVRHQVADRRFSLPGICRFLSSSPPKRSISFHSFHFVPFIPIGIQLDAALLH
jgi:hypothetical protein